MKNIYFLICSLIALNSFGQGKEILIIGTMHKVPKLVKNSYKPLLKYALKYKPDAIYVECVRSTDSISLSHDVPEFVRQADSISQIFIFDNKRFDDLNNTDLNKFKTADFKFMTKIYLLKKDFANYSYYKYLTKYGINGSSEPLRHENGDLTAKLAIAMNSKYIYSMDDQKNRQAYHLAWEKCIESGAENGDNEVNQKLGKKQYKSAIIPALFGRLGKRTNKLISLNRLHSLNSFRYVQNENSHCENATKYWDERNNRMAKNIAEQVKQESNLKNIVIVGAGHVIGIKEALEKNYPEIKVKIMYK